MGDLAHESLRGRDAVGMNAGKRHRDYFFHRALAALFAIADRLRVDRLSARALPPLSPPLRPILARYSWIGVRSGFSSVSSVDSRTISAARSLGSLGSFLERIMHSLLPHYLCRCKGETGGPS